MANVMKQPDVKYIKWQEGMRVTGKRHHNIIRRKRLMKAS